MPDKLFRVAISYIVSLKYMHAFPTIYLLDVLCDIYNALSRITFDFSYWTFNSSVNIEDIF
jgi:hypothetical protein